MGGDNISRFFPRFFSFLSRIDQKLVRTSEKDSRDESEGIKISKRRADAAFPDSGSEPLPDPLAEGASDKSMEKVFMHV